MSVISTELHVGRDEIALLKGIGTGRDYGFMFLNSDRKRLHGALGMRV